MLCCLVCLFFQSNYSSVFHFKFMFSICFFLFFGLSLGSQFFSFVFFLCYVSVSGACICYFLSCSFQCFDTSKNVWLHALSFSIRTTFNVYNTYIRRKFQYKLPPAHMLFKCARVCACMLVYVLCIIRPCTGCSVCFCVCSVSLFGS